MNTPNRHMRYRRSVYRRKRIKNAVIIAACALLVSVITVIIIGNALGNKVAQNNGDNMQSDTGNSSASKQVKLLNAAPVALSESGTTLQSRLYSASRNGYEDVCFNLDTKSGTLYYVSRVAQSLGKQSSDTSDLRSLDNIAGLLDTYELYGCAIAHVGEFDSDDDLIRASAIGYHASQISEVLRAGIDDVLVYPDTDTPEHYRELIRLATEVRRLTDKGVIGIALPPSLLTDFSNLDHKQLIYELSESFDYVAADLSTVSAIDGESVGADVYVDTMLGHMQSYALQYSMRILVPFTDDSALAASIQASVKSRGVNNVQIMPK